MATHTNIPLTTLPGVREAMKNIKQDGGTLETPASCYYEDLIKVLQLNPSLVIIPNAFKEGKLYSTVPGALGDLDVVRATTKTRTNSLGVIETVPINVAALDYTNGSCPSWSVEPQRTNLKPRSNDWTNSGYFLTNVTQSQSLPQPLFGTTALQIRETTTNQSHFIQILPDAVLVIGQVYTRSFYVKPTPNRTVFNLRDAGQLQNDCTVNLSTKTVISKGTNVGNVFFKDQIDGIIKVETTFTATGIIGRPVIEIFLNNTTSAYVGDVNEGIDLYHIQYELGANATSSITTLASAVTRNADIISKTGISDLIGQMEGTLFVDFNSKFNVPLGAIFALSDGTSNNRFLLTYGNTGLVQLYFTSNGNGSVRNITTILNNTRYKLAFNYINGVYNIYLNGQNINFTSIADNVPLNLNKLDLGSQNTSFVNDIFINKFVNYKTRLSNAESIELTTL